jgi:2-succinyl-5-enolpyruvyl-6-hydroxy-3-cyclohexene-1-carboxylate synthase
MTHSVDAQAGMARTLVDEWARAGVDVAAVAPGSRSTPLALALAGDRRIRVEVFLDERSAAFFALGAGRGSGRPAVVLCTSGTAAANFHPAVLEARHGRVPLVVCTADRPPELRDTGAGQAVDQLKLYGDAVRWFAEVSVADAAPGAGRYWRSLAARAAVEALGPPAGPVHLNLAFRDPLVPTGEPTLDAPGRAGGRPWTESTAPPRGVDAATVERVARAVEAAPRGALVAGWGAGVDAATVERFAAAAGWPVLADPLSGCRSGPNAVSTYDTLLRIPDVAARLRPDFVVHVGAPLTGKVATAWLDESVPRVVVDPDGAWLDPHRSASERIVADPGALLAGVADELPSAGSETPWLKEWLAAEAAARPTIDDLLDGDDEPFEGRVARDVVDCLPDGATLVVGSSMPVRDVEAFARPRRGLRFLSNRGVSGIDGFVSTVLGVAFATDGHGPVAALCGDLTFLHDTGGLIGAAARGIDATFVVVDNHGGGIFSFLPQANLPEHFETLFGTPHDVDIVDLCRAHHVPATRVTGAGDVVPAVHEAIDGGGVRVVIVPTDRESNVARHRRVHQAVASTLT